MLDYYYAIDRADKFNELFGNLYIGKQSTKNKNKYHILKLDFSGLDVDSETSLEYMKEIFNKNRNFP